MGKDKQTRGPKPKRLKIDADWKDAVKRAIEKPPPEKAGDPEHGSEQEQASDTGEG